MAANKLELIVEVSTAGANAALRGINEGLSAFEQVAVRCAENAAKGFDKFELAAARITKQFAANVKQFISDPLGAAGNMAEGLINKMGPLGTAALGVASAFGALFVAGANMAHQLGEQATALYNTSVRMGLSIEDTKRLSIAVKMAGGEIGDLETGMKMLSKGMSENSESGAKARKALHDLGITAGGSTIETLTQIGQKLAEIPTHWERNAIAAEIFNKQGINLLPMLMDLGSSLDKVKDAHLGMTEAEVEAGKRLHAQAVLADERLEKIKREYFAKPLAAIWSITVDFVEKMSPFVRDALIMFKNGATPAGSMRAAQEILDAHQEDKLRPYSEKWATGEARTHARLVKSMPGAFPKEAIVGGEGGDGGGNAAGKIEVGLEREIVGLYIQRLSAGQQIFAQGQERLAQLREEHELTAKTLSLTNIKTRMQWQNYSNSLIPGLDKTPFAASSGAGYDLSFYANNPTVANTIDVDPSILDKNAKAARDFALKGAAMGAKGGDEAAQLALIARRKELGVDSLTLAQEQAQVQIDAETKLAQMQQDRLTALKDGFNQVFDSLMSGGKNLMQTLMNLFKAAAITPVRNAFSSAFAGLFAPVLNSGARGPGATSGNDAGSGLPYSVGAGSGFGILGVGGFGANGPGSGMLGLLGKLKLKGGFGGKNGDFENSAMTMGGMMLLSDGWRRDAGSVGGTAERIGGAGSMAYGIAGKQLGVFGSAGVGLAADGLKRGGGWGMLEDTAGGAMIGSQFGGPMGALIGGAIGLGVGALRWAFGGKSPEQRMKDAVKDAYGVSIDTAYAKSLVQRAGGIDFRVFIQQASIRDEILLYTQMTKQSIGSNLGIDKVARGVNITESGGSLYQSATYSAGGAFGYQSSLASLGSFQTLTPNVTVVANMDGRATTNFLGGAAVNATSQSQGRTGLASNLLSPAMGTI